MLPTLYATVHSLPPCLVVPLFICSGWQTSLCCITATHCRSDIALWKHGKQACWSQRWFDWLHSLLWIYIYIHLLVYSVVSPNPTGQYLWVWLKINYNGNVHGHKGTSDPVQCCGWCILDNDGGLWHRRISHRRLTGQKILTRWIHLL